MLKEVNWSIDRDYKTGSSDEPLQFYLDALCNSTTFDLLLGYFSSSAINLLSLGFANFIYSLVYNSFHPAVVSIQLGWVKPVGAGTDVDTYRTHLNIFFWMSPGTRGFGFELGLSLDF